MREIKFRAWDYTENKMMDTSELSYGVRYNKSKIEIVSQKDCFIFMQYTGLKDKNGVEIYEGDIVYISGLGNYQVEFPFIELYEACYENDIGNILGNIYENKDLLDD